MKRKTRRMRTINDKEEERWKGRWRKTRRRGVKKRGEKRGGG